VLRQRVITMLCAALVLTTACAGDDPADMVTVTVAVGGEFSRTPVPLEVPEEAISFWSTETQPERIEITGRIIDAFSEQTGIEVIRVYVAEDALPGTMREAARAGNLPEIVFHPVDFTMGWVREGWLDVDAADAAVESLGRGTFSAGALDLVTTGGKAAAVPSDGWGQLLIYRRDLFDAAGLAVPDTFDHIEEAAAALHGSSEGMLGIAAATAADTVFTQQTFEHFALANGCRLIDEFGAVGLDSPNCVEALDFYTRLVGNYGPGEAQDASSTRDLYFSGRAAMIVWSPFILDEMAGLRDDAMPDCEPCAADPTFLVKNSGIVPSFSGPGGDPVQYGQVSLMGIGSGSNTAAAQAFLDYWFNEGYLAWLSTSAEGKFPLRRGVPDDPAYFVDEWTSLEFGVDRKAPIGDLYGSSVVDTLVAGSSHFGRWGFASGHGELVGALYSSLPVPAALEAILEGSLTPAEAAARLARTAELELEALLRTETTLASRL